MKKEKIDFDIVLTYNQDPEFKNYFPMLSNALKEVLGDRELEGLYREQDWFIFWNNNEIVAILSLRNPEYSYLPIKYNCRYIDTLEVAEDEKGKGIGSQVLNIMTEDGGIYLIYTDDYNYSFYEKNGFQILDFNKKESFGIKGIDKEEIREYL